MMLMNNSLPKNWVISCVGDIYKILESGSRPSGGVKAFSEGIPSIGAEHINNRGGFNFTHIRYVPAEFASTVRRGKIELEDILIVKDGATTGRVSFVNKDFPYSSAILNEHVFKLKVNTEVINQKLLFYYLYSQAGQKMILSSFHGAAQGGINQQFIKSVFIPHPVSEKDQLALLTRIEALLYQLAEARRLHEKIVADTNRLMESVLAEIYPTNDEQLPEGWKLLPLSDICTINPTRPRNLSQSDVTMTSFIPMAAVDDREGRISDLQTRPFGEVKRGYTYFEENDVLFAKITPCMENGKAAVARGLINGFGFGSTEFHVLRPTNRILPEWIYYFVRRETFRQEAKTKFRGAVGQQRVPADFLETHLIPVPFPENIEKSLTIQQQIITLVQTTAREVAEAQLGNNKTGNLLNQMEQSILAQAFRGEL